MTSKMKIFTKEWISKIEDTPKVGDKIKVDIHDSGLKSLKNTFEVVEVQTSKRGDFDLNEVVAVKLKKDGKAYSYNCFCSNYVSLFFDNRPEGHIGWVA